MDKRLAYETLSQIINYIKDDQSCLLQLDQTCKKFHRLCTPFLYKSPHFKTFRHFELFTKTLSLENGAHVRHIDLHMVPHRWDPKTNDLLYTLTEKTPDLELLNLELCYRLTNKALKRITKPLHDLRILSVDQCETIGDDAIEEVVINCPYLQMLYLGSTHITDNSLNLIATKLILLTHLYVPGCEYITEVGVNKVLRDCKTLQHINIMDCYNVVGNFGSRLSLRLLSRRTDLISAIPNLSSDIIDAPDDGALFETERGEDEWEDIDEEEEDLLDGDHPPAYNSVF